MKMNAVFKSGAVLCILLGLAYIVTTITFIMLPSVFGGEAGYGAYLQAVAESPSLEIANWWARAFIGIFGIGAIMAISGLVQPTDESGLVRYTSALAYLGFAAQALERFKLIGVVPELAEAYVAAGEPVQAAIAANFRLVFLDHAGWLGFGAVGFWLLVVNWVGLRQNVLPKVLSYLGLVVGLTFWLVTLSILPEITLPVAFTLTPIFFIWMGLALRRAAPAQEMPQQRSVAGAKTV